MHIFWQELVFISAQLRYNINENGKSRMIKELRMKDRKFWVSCLDKTVRPVLSALAEDKLKETFPLWDEAEEEPAEHRTIAWLEAESRIFPGIAPWLDAEVSDEEERALQAEYRVMAQKALHNCICPESKDYIEWWDGTSEPSQHLVEAYNFAFASLVAPKTLWENLPEEDKKLFVRALTRVNHRRPIANNWRMFTATIETALYQMTGECDPMRVQFALMEHDLAYRGDGMYADGEPFSWDSYSSGVMSPLMVEISRTLKPLFSQTASGNYGEDLYNRSVARMAALVRKLECLVRPDGSYPALGRSITGRNWMFSLSYAAFRGIVPKDVPLGRVRTELTAVIKKLYSAETLFSKAGYLRAGLYGYQPSLKDSYITQGSIYCITNLFAALGLSDTDAFWTAEPQPPVWELVWGKENPAPELTATEERKLWLNYMDKVCRPVLIALKENRLKESLPIAESIKEGKTVQNLDRIPYAPLEAFGRMLNGIAPWLEVELPEGEEKELQKEYLALIQEGLDKATDPTSPAYMIWRDKAEGNTSQQYLVDAANVAAAINRAPNALYFSLSERVQKQIIAALNECRKIIPPTNNWLLFGGMLDAALLRVTGKGDAMRLEAAVIPINKRYLGDGTYGDGIYVNGQPANGCYDKGKTFEWSYYNSLVLHPMMDEQIEALGKIVPAKLTETLTREENKRLARYCVVLERQVSPDGSLPPTGRSLVYRAGVMHALSYAAWKGKLHPDLAPSKARKAITKVIHRTLSHPETFDENGFLTVGLCGKQPSQAQNYISGGSTYACCAAFVALGLPPTHEFWQGEEKNTWEKIWSGVDMKGDHATY